MKISDYLVSAENAILIHSDKINIGNDEHVASLMKCALINITRSGEDATLSDTQVTDFSIAIKVTYGDKTHPFRCHCTSLRQSHHQAIIL